MFHLFHPIVFTWLAMNYFVLIPIQCYYLHQYYKHRNSNFLHPRRPNLNILAVMVSIYFTSIHSAIYLLIEYLNILSKYVSFTFFVSGFMFAALSMIVRAFQIYFDLNYNASVSDKIWTHLINPNINNFFINYRSTLGKPKYNVICMVINCLICVVITYLIGSFFGFHMELLCLLCMIFIALLIVGIIGYKISSFKDHIYIRYEIFYQCIIGGIGVLIMLLTILYTLFVHYDHDLTVFLYGILSPLVVHGCSLISTYWVLRKMKQFQVTLNMTNMVNSSHEEDGYEVSSITSITSDNKESVIDMTTGTNSNSSKSSKSQKTRKVKKLKHFLAEPQNLKGFVHHLNKEYSLENAIFIIESNQWRQLCIFKHSNIFGIEDKKTIIDLPSDIIPKSLIVYTKCKTIQESFIELYLKYIDPSTSNWPINIGYDARQCLDEQHQHLLSKYNKIATFKTRKLSFEKKKVNSQSQDIDIDIEDEEEIRNLWEAMNGAVKDVWNVLFDSYFRFQHTIQFAELGDHVFIV